MKCYVFILLCLASLYSVLLFLNKFKKKSYIFEKWTTTIVFIADSCYIQLLYQSIYLVVMSVNCYNNFYNIILLYNIYYKAGN